MAALRSNQSMLVQAEQALIRTIVSRLPPWVLPLHLTLVGIGGAVLAFIGLVGCTASVLFFPLIPIGIGMNWFGDSLDGSLARFRRIERPRFGMVIDHSADLMSKTIIITGFGLSPYMTMTSAMFVLVMYLLFSSYTYLRLATDHVHQMSYGGLGATEFRMLMIAWAVFAQAEGPALLTRADGALRSIDLIVGCLCACAFVGFVVLVRSDLIRIGHEERTQSKSRVQTR